MSRTCDRHSSITPSLEVFASGLELADEVMNGGETSDRWPMPSRFGAVTELKAAAEARFGRVDTGPSLGVKKGLELNGTRDRRMPNAGHLSRGALESMLEVSR